MWWEGPLQWERASDVPLASEVAAGVAPGDFLLWLEGCGFAARLGVERRGEVEEWFREGAGGVGGKEGGEGGFHGI